MTTLQVSDTPFPLSLPFHGSAIPYNPHPLPSHASHVPPSSRNLQRPAWHPYHSAQTPADNYAPPTPTTHHRPGRSRPPMPKPAFPSPVSHQPPTLSPTNPRPGQTYSSSAAEFSPTWSVQGKFVKRKGASYSSLLPAHRSQTAELKPPLGVATWRHQDPHRNVLLLFRPATLNPTVDNTPH